MAKEQARKLGYFIIVEGYLDAIACHQYGIRNAVATLGTALTEGHLRLMRRFAEKLVLIFDPDPAGVRASLRSFDLFVSSGMKVNVVSLPDNEDPDTFLQKHGQEGFAARLRESMKFMDFVLVQVIKPGSAASIDEKVEKAGEMLGYISRLPSGIERDYYLKKTAEELELDEAVLRQEMKTAKSTTHPEKKDKQAAPSPRFTGRRLRKSWFICCSRDESIARHLKDQISPSGFYGPAVQTGGSAHIRRHGCSGSIDLRSLQVEGDEEFNRVISYYSVLELEYEIHRRTSGTASS